MKLTFKYGRSPSQTGDLYVPERPVRGVICLLHGGFWKLPYGREQFTSVAQDLLRRGYAVWNLGYRRIGEPGGGWPGSFDDVYAGVDYLQQIAKKVRQLDLTRIILVGHSAGGHLALWRAAQSRSKRSNSSRCFLDISGVAALAPLADLKAAHRDQIGGDAVVRLLGGAPAESAPLWAAASPAQMLPVGVPQLLLHGELDETVPVAHSERYAEAATAAGDRVELLSLPDTGHMDFLKPGTVAHVALCSRLDLPSSAGWRPPRPPSRRSPFNP